MEETKIGLVEDPVERFFAFVAEREAVRIRRARGDAYPWTDDWIMRKFRFCNVFREDDTTTAWLRDNVRDQLRDSPLSLLAVVAYRWFNRICAGEAIFLSEAWPEFAKTGDGRVLKAALLEHCGDGPYTTGSYMIASPTGMPRVDGVVECVSNFWRWRSDLIGGMNWFEFAQELLEGRGSYTLLDVHGWLKTCPFQGAFTAYEVVTDMRHTALLDRAPDIMTWANVGPGSRRGLNRIHGRPLKAKTPDAACVAEMVELLEISDLLWPISIEGVKMPRWEMRDVEHSLCEFEKMERARLAQGVPKNIFRNRG